MSYKGIIHSLILLLAVWSPLNNAIASAAVVGCPMNMSHTLEHGFQLGLSSPAHHQPSQAAGNHCSGSDADCSQVASNLHMQYAQSDCDSGCHCSFCLLLGASALTDSMSNIAVFGAAPSHTAIPQASAVGHNRSPFRPPISPLV